MFILNEEYLLKPQNISIKWLNLKVTVLIDRYRRQTKPGIVVSMDNSSTQKAEAGGSPWVQDQPELHSKFQENLGYKVSLAFKTQNKQDYLNFVLLRC